MELTQASVIEEIKRVAQKLGRDYLSIKEFSAETGLSTRKILRHFDKWNDAVKKAGLTPLDKKGKPDSQKGYSEQELLQMIKRIASEHGTAYLSETDFCKSAGISYRPIKRVFGDWNTAIQKAGLSKHPAHNLRIPDVELFQEYLQVTDTQGRFPSYTEFARRSKYSIGVYEHRFGNFTEFRKHAIQFGIDKGLIKPEIAQPTIENLPVRTNRKELSYNALDDRPVLGERIDFRSMVHAPINELGVVCLFGILSNDLGFTIESIQQGFPDCEAKRRLKNDRWQSVRVEFEYKSSHFLVHQHPITGCDIIVCWIHDWKECPLEVVELKSEINKLKSK